MKLIKEKKIYTGDGVIENGFCGLNEIFEVVEGDIFFICERAFSIHEQDILKLRDKLVGQSLFVECGFVILVVILGVADYGELVLVLKNILH